jgi:hypothetical protein
MKKMILVLAIITSTLSAFASDEKVSKEILSSFNTEFATAQEVTWSVQSDYIRAEFTFNSQRVNAFYSPSGELLGLTRYITSYDLPMFLQASLKKSYNDYWISDLFEVTKDNATSYYITLQNAEGKLVLKGATGEDWTTHKKVKKI